MATLTENICIPIHLDAFALSPDCADGASKLAPYTQPNYMALRLDSHLIQNDVLEQVDFHLAGSAATNPRLSDVGSAQHPLKLHRLGIHLHWTIPRFYRTATATAKQSQLGDENSDDSKPDKSQPSFPAIPNRWLVIRHLQSCEPAGVLPQFQGWIIESDVVRKITEITDPSVDLQSDVSPFVSYTGRPSDPAALRNQAEIFLGQKFDLPGWREDAANRKHTRLTVMNSSNPLFPDYALHNTNVLSMIDNFRYIKPGTTTVSYCTKASAHYYVLGWHSDRQDDPLANIPAESTLEQKLSSMMLQLNIEDGHNPDDNALGGAVRSLNHGALYNVAYNRGQKPISTADETAKNFTAKIDMEPLSLGTTTLDAILTFLKAHRDDAASIFKTENAVSVVKEILQISSLLYASDDGYDSRMQAEDLIAQRNFAKSDGGSYWTSNQQSKGRPPVVPSDDIQKQLRDLNASQIKLDATTRKLRSIQWDLFAEWWKYVSRSFPDPKIRDSIIPGLQKRVDRLKKECDDLLRMQKALEADVKKISDSMAVKKSSFPPYYSRSDPTLCIAGMDSGRPKDFMDRLSVQETHQLPADTSGVDAMFKDASGKALTMPFPVDNKLADTAKRLLAQCLAKNPGKPDLAVTTGYQNWGSKNPFIPLFMEWEAVYYHVDNPKHDAWSVDVRASPENPRSQQVRYAPVNILRNDPSSQNDTRTLSGRVLVLPQPAFNLEATVKQVLGGTSPDVALKGKELDDLLTNIRNMQFISARLSGLTNHLLTRFEGAHVKPNIRSQGQTVIPLAAAVEAGSPIRIDRNTLRLIDAQTALTPYGSSYDFNTPNYPFKPVTQGQLIFTKLNIVDKFGQAICIPTPRPRRKNPLTVPQAGIYPCLSDYLTPDVRDGKLNTIFELPGHAIGTGDPGSSSGEGDWPLCQYMQLTPAINQDARLNASFVIRDSSSSPTSKPQSPSPWRVVNSDYEQPIWGWIVINYADRGLQFFLRDGTFYQEIRLGGANGTNTSTKYIPFKPSSVTGKTFEDEVANKQLDELISLFDRSPEYLQCFSDMINAAIKTMPFPPGDYAAYANAIVGKPLALVNLGVSLELSAPALVAQNTFGKLKHRDEAFTGSGGDQEDIGRAYQADLEGYSFPVKIGDASRVFDGVVCYFDADNSAPGKPTPPAPPPAGKPPAGGPTTTPSAGAGSKTGPFYRGKTDWTNLYTYFLPPDEDLPTPGSSPTTMKPIAPSTFPAINPYYIHPNVFSPAQPPAIDAVDIPQLSVAKMTIKTVLMDPYTPLHVYSPILPTAKVQLPAWTIETALKKMSAFFRLGPMLLVEDVPRSMPLPVVSIPPVVVPATGTGGSGGAGSGGSGSGSGSATPAMPPTPTPTPVPGPVPAAGSSGGDSGGAAGTPGTTTPAAGTGSGSGAGTGTGSTAPAAPEEHVVRLPISGRKGTWKWLQPYDTEPDKADAPAEFFKYPVEEDQGQVKFAPGPYTFVEGYLLLAGQTFAGLNQGGNAA